MRYVALALILAVTTTVAASKQVPMVSMQDGRAECIGFDPDKLSVGQSGQDWRVRYEESGGFTTAILSSKEDADAALAVIQKNKYTAVCTIGLANKGQKTFRYFESARR
jgi:hypothetical protein